MAWIHSLWISASSIEQQKHIFDHFSNCTPLSIKGTAYSIQPYLDGMITASGKGISNRGISSIEEAYILSILGFRYYQLLQTAPSFDYALAGVEVDGAISRKELLEDPDWLLGINGFVIAEGFYQELGCPGELVPFKKGYYWNPYCGEFYYNAKSNSNWCFWNEHPLPSWNEQG